jgi:hypothetical protein
LQFLGKLVIPAAVVRAHFQTRKRREGIGLQPRKPPATQNSAINPAAQTDPGRGIVRSVDAAHCQLAVHLGHAERHRTCGMPTARFLLRAAPRRYACRCPGFCLPRLSSATTQGAGVARTLIRDDCGVRLGAGRGGDSGGVLRRAAGYQSGTNNWQLMRICVAKTCR